MLVAGHVGAHPDRIDAWQHPFDPTLFSRRSGGSYQLAQGLFAQADGGVLGQGFGGAVLELPRQYCAEGQTVCSLLPAPHTDFIYAVIVNELGLVGAAGLLFVYLLIVQRGFKIAMLARDSFSKLLAAGLTSVFALQVFVIVGGVTKLIPLTGVTLPFVSYGGSSILANFVLLALLLLVSERREARGMNTPIRRLFVVFVAAVRAAARRDRRGGRSCEADDLNRDHADQNRRDLLRGMKIRRGDDPRRRRHGHRALRARTPRASTRAATRRATSSATRSATRTPDRGQTELEAFYNASSSGGASATRRSLLRPAGRQPRRRRRPAHDARPRGPEARRAT